MKYTITLLTIATIAQIATCGGHGVVHDKESFLKVYNSDSPTKDIAFAKKYFKTEQTILDRVEYVNFLASFLETHINDLPEDEDIREEAILHHKEQAEAYLTLQHQKDTEDFGIAEVVRDIGIGNFLVYVGSGGNAYAHEEFDQETLNFLKENGVEGELEDDDL
jgi:hypothetical protein